MCFVSLCALCPFGQGLSGYPSPLNGDGCVRFAVSIEIELSGHLLQSLTFAVPHSCVSFVGGVVG